MGTFIPSIGNFFTYQREKIGYMLSFQRNFSLYENKLYYLPGSSLNWSLGLWYPWTIKSTSLLQIVGRHESIDTWRGLPAAFSGRDALSIVWSQSIKIKKKQELILRLDRLVFVNNRSETQVHDGEGFPLYTTFSLGYTFF